MSKKKPEPTADQLQLATLKLQKETAALALQEAKDAAARGAIERAAALKAEREQVAQEKEDAAAAKKKADEDKLEKEAEQRRKATIANIGAVSSGLNSLTGSSLTLPEKTVFREALVASIALKDAGDVAAAAIIQVASAAPVTVTSPGRILVTGRTDQVDTVLAALAFKQPSKT